MNFQDAIRQKDSLPVEKFAFIAERNGVHSMAGKIRELAGAVPVSIGFLGEYNAGKSTLVNALIGKRILPATVIPTTASITEILPSKEQEKIAYYERATDGYLETISVLDFNDIATGKRPGKAVAKIPATERLPEGFQFIDTPGLGSLNETHTDITYGYLPYLDGAIICIDIEKGGVNKSVISFLSREDARPLTSRFVIALCKADMKNKDAVANIREQVCADLRESASRKGWSVDNDRIVPVSALSALEGNSSEGIDAITNAMSRFFVSPKASLEAIRRRVDLIASGENLLNLLREQKENLRLDDTELHKREDEVEAEIEGLKNKRQVEKDRLDKFIVELRESLFKLTTKHIPYFENSTEDNIGEICNKFTIDMCSSVEEKIKKYIKDVPHPNLGVATEDLKNKIENIIKLGEYAKTLVTAIIIAALTGIGTPVEEAAELGGGAVGKEAVKEGAKQVAKKTIKSGFLKFLGMLSLWIEKSNPVNHLGDYILAKIKKDTARTYLSSLAEDVSEHARGHVEAVFEEGIFRPIEASLVSQKEALDEISRERSKGLKAIELRRLGLDSDISELVALMDSESRKRI